MSTSLNNKVLLEVSDASVTAGGREILSDFSFQLFKGEKLCLEGPSGTGKSSILKGLLGLNTNFQASIKWQGRPLESEDYRFLRTVCAYMPQHIQFNRMTVDNMILEFHHLNRFSSSAEKYLSEVHLLMNELKLYDELHIRQTDRLSGGEKQRLGLALALSIGREVLILDEPVSSLDRENISVVSKLIIGKDDLTVLSASHDKDWNKLNNRSINIQGHKTY